MFPAKIGKQMFGFFKNIFGSQAATVGQPATKIGASALTSASAARQTAGSAYNSPPVVAKATRPHANGNGGNGNANGHGNGHGVQLPLQPILNSLPSDLRRMIAQSDVGDASVCLPVEKILPQLGRGIVKITFGELRNAAPGIFLSQPDHDQVQITLPLAVILEQLNPELLVRRPAKTHVKIPSNVSSPFESRGQGAVFAVGTGKVQPMTPPPRVNTPVPSKPPEAVHNRSTFLSMSPPVPPVAKQPVSAPPVVPDAPVLRMVTPRVEAPVPAPPLKVPTPAPMPMPASIPEAEPIAFVAAEPAATKEILTVSLGALLGSLAGRWPETVRSDIVRMNLMSAKVELPVDIIEPALKRGKVPLKWATLRSWLKPAPLLNMSQHDDVIVELPLNILAPLFVERQRAAGKDRRKVAIDETIPDLFFGLPQSESPVHLDSCSVTRPSDTNFITKPQEVSFTPAPAETKTPDTNFYSQPVAEESPAVPGSTDFIKRSQTPKEIVARAVLLENIAGAFITLPDGLMVAGHIPPDLNGDTLAAFVPQIFNKLNQACAELRMGELNNVAFTVGNVPWKIFRVNAVFFAAFGRASEQMPTALLAQLAAELNQKNY